MSCKIPVKEYKTEIRKVDFGGISVGGQNGLPYLYKESSVKSKPLIGVEILAYLPDNYPAILKKSYGQALKNPVEWAKVAVNTGADILAIRFNMPDSLNIPEEIARCQLILNEILNSTDIPVIIIGADNRDIDIKLLPELAKSANRACTIGLVEEDTYKEIVAEIKNLDHNVIARTPIDINLAKELNILISEMGFNPDRIIIDPNMGALGYGMDYAYSVIERIRLAALQGDTMLNMPIIAFAGIESWKTKEAKAVHVPEEWGDDTERAISWECSTAVSMLAAGADIVVLYHPESVRHINKFINKIFQA